MKKAFYLISFLLTGIVFIHNSAAYTISGLMSNFGDGVIVTLSGDASMVTHTDPEGYYVFSGLSPGDYTITPDKPYTPPQVNITNPAAGGSVTGNVDIKAVIRTDLCDYAFSPPSITITSLDGDKPGQDFAVMATSCYFSLASVDFYIDGILLQMTAPHEGSGYTVEVTCRWETTSFTDGLHTIKVEARDSDNGTGQNEIEVTVNNGNNSLLGDVNLDGIVNIVDALAIARSYVGMAVSVFDPPLADVNVDDAINIVDALLVARFYVGLVAELPEQKPGGYDLTAANSEYALDAYEFLKNELSALHPEIIPKAIKLAFCQVVAGTNIRLIVSYRLSGAHEDLFLAAVVFLNFDMVAEELVSLKTDIY